MSAGSGWQRPFQVPGARTGRLGRGRECVVIHHDAHPVDPLVEEDAHTWNAPPQPTPQVFTGTVTCLHRFVIRHVVQINQVRPLRLVDEPAVEFLINVADTRLPNEMRRASLR